MASMRITYTINRDEFVAGSPETRPDHAASAERYADEVDAALREDYPDAAIEVEVVADPTAGLRVETDDEPADPDTVDAVARVADAVYQGRRGADWFVAAR